MGCVTNTDVPTTFTATVTVTADADQTSVYSGECTIVGIRVAPNEQLNILGDSGVGSTRSTLETETIDQNPNGSGTCTYTSHFAAIPANQRSYDLYLHEGFAQQSITSGELKNGATYVLHSSTPDSATGN